MLVEQLPEGSRTWAEHAGWGVREELLAQIVEGQDRLLIAIARMSGAKRVRKPITVPRPGRPRKKRSAADTVKAFARKLEGGPG